MSIILYGFTKDLRRVFTRVFMRIIQAIMVMALAGCATQTHDVSRSSVSVDKFEQNISGRY